MRSPTSGEDSETACATDKTTLSGDGIGDGDALAVPRHRSRAPHLVPACISNRYGSIAQHLRAPLVSPAPPSEGGDDGEDTGPDDDYTALATAPEGGSGYTAISQVGVPHVALNQLNPGLGMSNYHSSMNPTAHSLSMCVRHTHSRAVGWDQISWWQ